MIATIDNEIVNLTPTQWDSVEDKAKFIRQFKTFVRGGFKRSQFHKWFYKRLSMTFGHIAHYDQNGFYEHFFCDEQGKREFIRQCAAYPCYGDPHWTYSDAERHLVQWLLHTYMVG